MSYSQELQKLGWTQKEAQIYVALLKLGIASANEIAIKANLKRTTVYNFLPELLQKGLIKKTRKKKQNTLLY